MLSVVGDVFTNSVAPALALSISSIYRPIIFEDAHRGRVCVRVFIGVRGVYSDFVNLKILLGLCTCVYRGVWRLQ